jgi:hypothetical protein
VEAIPNQAPTLNGQRQPDAAIGNQTISEHLPFTFTATATDADAGQTLTFSLANGTSGLVPAGASINPTTGLFSWTPTESQGPGTFTFDVVVTDNGSPCSQTERRSRSPSPKPTRRLCCSGLGADRAGR